MLPRIVQPETLDYLEESDPLAIRSRADLRRINYVMGTQSIMLDAMRRTGVTPRRILEIGAGDGTLLLALARRQAREWSNVNLTLLDRQNTVSSQTRDAFRQLGWQIQILNIDILDWIRQPVQEKYDIGLANLFMHHFEDEELPAIFAGLTERTEAFCLCEPRRSRLALLGSYFVGLLGANRVTREDAVLSVRAGFKGAELSRFLLPLSQTWKVQEYEAGLFTHCLVAVGKSARPK